MNRTAPLTQRVRCQKVANRTCQRNSTNWIISSSASRFLVHTVILVSSTIKLNEPCCCEEISQWFRSSDAVSAQLLSFFERHGFSSPRSPFHPVSIAFKAIDSSRLFQPAPSERIAHPPASSFKGPIKFQVSGNSDSLGRFKRYLVDLIAIQVMGAEVTEYHQPPGHFGVNYIHRPIDQSLLLFQVFILFG